MYVGIDLVQIDRITRILERNPKTLDKILNDDEKVGSIETLSGRIAAKEATIKSVPGLTMRNFLDISVSYEKTGRPKVSFSNIDLQKFRVDISISHEKELVVAIALATLDASVAQEIHEKGV